MAKTEAKKEMTISLEHGHSYYIQCGLSMGALVGRPQFAQVGKAEGRYRFNLLQRKSK